MRFSLDYLSLKTDEVYMFQLLTRFTELIVVLYHQQYYFDKNQ